MLATLPKARVPAPASLRIEPPSFFKSVAAATQPRKIFIAGSSGNPTHLDHYGFLDDLRLSDREIDWLIWIPCGERLDKHASVCHKCPTEPGQYCHACANHRIAMTEMSVGAFRHSSIGAFFSIWYDDIFGLNTPTIVWLERLAKLYPQAELTWVTGADSVVPRKEFGGRNEIQAAWKEGDRLWNTKTWKWLIYQRPGYPLDNLVLPENFEVSELKRNRGLSSSQIRQLIAAGNPIWEDMVDPLVAGYIKQWRLYGYGGKIGDG